MENHPNNIYGQPLNKRSLFQPFLGLFYTLLGCVFITLSLVFVKELTYISPGQLTLVRSTGVLSGILPFALYSAKEILGPKEYRILLIVRGFFMATFLYLELLAFRNLPLAEAAVIVSTSPVVVSVIARIFLQEPCGIVQSFCVLITVSGVLLSVRLPELLSDKEETHTDLTYLGGLASAVGSVLMLSVSLVLLRKMKDVHFSVFLLYSGFIGSLETAFLNYFVSYYEKPYCGWDVLRVMMIGVFGFVGQWAITVAVLVEAVGTVVVMKACLEVVVAMVFQSIFFKIQLDIYSIGGACLVILSVSVIGARNWMLTQPDGSEIRQRFKFLLL